MRFPWQRDIKLVEVEATKPLEPMTEELAQQIAALQYHAGFNYLLRKLMLQRSLLTSTLVKERQASLQDSEFIKSGIAWTAWLEDQLRQAASFQKRQSPPREALDAELEAFQLAQRQLELVGR